MPSSITIEGISNNLTGYGFLEGKKYQFSYASIGDVLQFEALPMRYRLNTVFSIINVTHAVSDTGIWKTSLRCIMRPSLD